MILRSPERDGRIARAGRFAIVSVPFLLLASPAAAHHVMGGKTPATFMQGLLSGLGHPIIGLDHLAFIIAVGVAVGIARLSLWTPIVFIAASAVGVALHAQGIGLPGTELIVALSVLAIGGLIAAEIRLTPPLWLLLFGAAGLFHGHAYGESIFGAERTPLYAYLLGLVIIQGAIATAAALLLNRATNATTAARLAGATVAGIGLSVLAGQLLPA